MWELCGNYVGNIREISGKYPGTHSQIGCLAWLLLHSLRYLQPRAQNSPSYAAGHAGMAIKKPPRFQSGPSRPNAGQAFFPRPVKAGKYTHWINPAAKLYGIPRAWETMWRKYAQLMPMP